MLLNTASYDIETVHLLAHPVTSALQMNTVRGECCITTVMQTERCVLQDLYCHEQLALQASECRIHLYFINDYCFLKPTLINLHSYKVLWTDVSGKCLSFKRFCIHVICNPLHSWSLFSCFSKECIFFRLTSEI
jgi:hypothetical protein